MELTENNIPEYISGIFKTTNLSNPLLWKDIKSINNTHFSRVF